MDSVYVVCVCVLFLMLYNESKACIKGCVCMYVCREMCCHHDSALARHNIMDMQQLPGYPQPVMWKFWELTLTHLHII